MNYKTHWYLFFYSYGTVNYASVSKLLDQTCMHLVLQLITHFTDSQELPRDLLLQLQMLDYCQLSVSIFIIFRTGSVVHQNPSTIVFRKNSIHKQDYLLPKKLLKYFSNDRQITHRTVVLPGISVRYSKRRCYVSLLKGIWKFAFIYTKIKSV